MDPIYIVLIVVLSVLVVALIAYGIFYVTQQNGFITLRTDVEEAYSTMDVYMKKRYDLIPNLVETCKGSAKFESSTLEAVVNARSLAMNATPENKAAAESALGSSLKTLLNVVHESYPQLQTNAQFMNLSRELENTERDIAQSRKYYNAKVKVFNVKVEKFPSNIIARKMRLTRKPFFEIDESERAAVKVSFDDSPKVRL